MFKLHSVAICMAFFLFGPSQAHEFWLEALDYTLTPDEQMGVELRVGEEFAGSKYPFVQQRFRKFTVTTQGKTRNYKGRAGDQPALQIKAPKAGLHVLAYHSTPDTLKFTKARPDLLETYLKAEGLDHVLKQHRADGLPEIGISEKYTRNAKALVQVGPDTGGKDVAVGLPFEWVVQGTPYDGDTSVSVRLLLRGKPVPDYPVNVFTKTSTVKQTRVRTDKNGFARIAFPKGSRVLMNSVWIERTAKGSDPFYESWWASMTFGW